MCSGRCALATFFFFWSNYYPIQLPAWHFFLLWSSPLQPPPPFPPLLWQIDHHQLLECAGQQQQLTVQVTLSSVIYLSSSFTRTSSALQLPEKAQLLPLTHSLVANIIWPPLWSSVWTVNRSLAHWALYPALQPLLPLPLPPLSSSGICIDFLLDFAKLTV